MRKTHSYSSLALLAECAEKFRYLYVDEIEAPETSLPLRAGTAFDAGVNYLYTQEWDAAKAGEVLREAWGDEKAPLGSKHGHLNPDFLVARLELYVEEREKSPTILEEGEILREFSGVSHDFEWTQEGVSLDLRGIPDFVVRDEAGKIWIPDLKTTSSWLTDHWMMKFRLGHQLRLYAALFQEVTGEAVAGGLINAVYVGEKALDEEEKWKTRKSSPSMVAKVDFTSEQVEDVHRWARGLVAIERTCEETGIWPRNEKACGAYGGCEFLPLCTAPNAAMQRALMMTKFKRKEGRR